MGVIMIFSGSRLYRRPLGSHLVTIVAFCLGLLWLIFIYDHGIHITPDSTKYMTFAMKMHYARDYSVNPLWPPLYPFLLNLFMFVEGFPAESAELISGISMMAFLVTFALTLYKFREGIVLNLLFLLTLFTFTKPLYVFHCAWAETPFSLFLILNFYFLLRHWETKLVGHYVLAALFVALAALTRYLGCSLIIAFFGYTVYFLFVYRGEKGISTRKYLLWNSITYIPIFLYMARNYFIWGAFHGSRGVSEITVGQNIYRACKVLGEDLNGYLLTLLAISLVLYLSLTRVRGYSLRSKFVLPLSFILFFVITYISLLVYTTSRVTVDDIETRYLAPIYFYCLLFIFISFSGALQFKTGKRGYERFRKYVLPLVLFSLILGIFFVQLRDFRFFMHLIAKRQYAGISCFISGFNRSPTLGGLRDYFKDIFSKQDKAYVSFFYEYRPESLWTYMGRRYVARSFFYRGSLLRIPGFSDFSFESIGEADYTIAFRSGSLSKALVYRNLPSSIENESQLIDEIRDVLTREDIGALWLIMYRRETPAEGRYISLSSADDLRIQSRADIDPYTIYQFARNGSDRGP